VECVLCDIDFKHEDVIAILPCLHLLHVEHKKEIPREGNCPKCKEKWLRDHI